MGTRGQQRVGRFVLAAVLFVLAAASVFVAATGTYDGAVRLAALGLAATYTYVGIGTLRAARRT